MKAFFYLFSLLIWDIMAAPSEDLDGTEALLEFTKGNRLFTANIYKQIVKEQNNNFVISPFSAEVVLALTNEGALGETSQELQTGLSLPSNKEITQRALKYLLPKLTKSNDDLKLLSANKIYTANDVKLNAGFNEVAQNIYQSGIENINFSANVEAAETINKWVEKQTNNRIQDLLKSDNLNSDTKLVLVNCLYFSGQWATPFDKTLTSKQKFHKTKDAVTEVEMMQVKDTFKYYENKKLNTKFIELPYLGGDVSLVIALPNEIDGLSKLEDNIEELLQPQSLTYEQVDLKVPKLKIETEIQLKPILEKLGIKILFTNDANLNGLTSTHKERLYVDKVVQKAFIELDEKGTEAAAATAEIIMAESLPPPPQVKFTADHPFLFYITENNVKLFVGRYGH